MANIGGSEVAIASDDAGKEHLVWQEGNSLWYSRFDETSQTWIDGRTIVDSDSATNLQLLSGSAVFTSQDKEGNQISIPGLVLVWQEGSGNDTDLYYTVGKYNESGIIEWAAESINLTDDEDDTTANQNVTAALQEVLGVNNSDDYTQLVLAYEKVDDDYDTNSDGITNDDTDLYYQLVELDLDNFTFDDYSTTTAVYDSPGPSVQDNTTDTSLLEALSDTSSTFPIDASYGFTISIGDDTSDAKNGVIPILQEADIFPEGFAITLTGQLLANKIKEDGETSYNLDGSLNLALDIYITNGEPVKSLAGAVSATSEDTYGIELSLFSQTDVAYDLDDETDTYVLDYIANEYLFSVSPYYWLIIAWPETGDLEGSLFQLSATIDGGLSIGLGASYSPPTDDTSNTVTLIDKNTGQPATSSTPESDLEWSIGGEISNLFFANDLIYGDWTKSDETLLIQAYADLILSGGFAFNSFEVAGDANLFALYDSSADDVDLGWAVTLTAKLLFFTMSWSWGGDDVISQNSEANLASSQETDTDDNGVIDITYNPTEGTTSDYNDDDSTSVLTPDEDAIADVIQDSAPAIAQPASKPDALLMAWVKETDNQDGDDANSETLDTTYPISTIQVRTSPGGAGQWTNATIIPDANGDPFIAMNFDPVVGFDEQDSGNILNFVVWAAVDGSDLTSDSSAQDVLDTIQETDIYFSYQNASTGGDWQAATEIIAQEGWDHNLTLGQTSDGKLISAWMNTQTDDESYLTSIYWTQWDTDSQSWETPTQLSGSSFTLSPYGSVSLEILDFDGSTAIFWTQTVDNSYYYAVRADDPLIYLRLDETSGTIAENLDGTLGTSYNASYNGSYSFGTTGALPNDVSTAVTFIDGSIDIPLQTTIPTASFSLEFWLQPTTSDGATLTIEPDSTTSDFSFTIDGDSLIFTINGIDSDGNSTTVTVSGTYTNLTDQDYYYIVAVYDQENAIASIYIGETLINQQTGFDLTRQASISDLVIDVENAVIDEFALYNIALAYDDSANEVEFNTVPQTVNPTSTNQINTHYEAQNNDYDAEAVKLNYSILEDNIWQTPTTFEPLALVTPTTPAIEREPAFDIVSADSLTPNGVDDLYFQFSLINPGKTITSITLTDDTNTWSTDSDSDSLRVLAVVQSDLFGNQTSLLSSATSSTFSHTLLGQTETFNLYADSDGLSLSSSQIYTVTIEFSDDTYTTTTVTALTSGSSGTEIISSGTILEDTATSLEQIDSGNIITTANNSTGQALAGGDFDGDSLEDIVISDDDVNSGDGGVYIILGGITSPLTLTEATAPTDGVWISGSDEEKAGYSVAIGDIDGDDIDDLIIGAPYADSRTGKVYVVYGNAIKDAKNSTISLDSLTSSQGFSISGESEFGEFGFAVSAGDIDNDGKAEILIGAPYANDNAGEVYLVYGKDSGSKTKIFEGTTQTIYTNILQSATKTIGSNAGFAVAISQAEETGKTSFNGDKYDDIIIGSPNVYATITYDSISTDSLNNLPGGSQVPDTVNVQAGEVYVIFGAESEITTTYTAETLANSTNKGIIFDGTPASGSTITSVAAGYSVAAAGDINKDGYDDLAIGAPKADNYQGEVYVIYGTNSGFDTSISLLNDSDITIYGAETFDHAGSSVSSAGDIDNDSYDDLLIASRHAGYSAGQSHIIFGSSSLDSTIDLSSTAENGAMVLNGGDTQDLSGKAVKEIGDVNNDGIDDVLISAPNAEQVYVVYGHTWLSHGGSVRLNQLRSDQGFFIQDDLSSSANKYSFYHLPTLADINGDGYDDLFYLQQTGTNIGNSSTAIVTLGGSTTELLDNISDESSFSLTIDNYDTELLGTMAGNVIGDFNGDGFDDIGIVVNKYKDEEVNGTVTFTPYQAILQVISGGESAISLLGEVEIFDDSTEIASVASLGDFNGDGFDDFAVLVKYSNSVKNGVVILYGNKEGTLPTGDLYELDDTSAGFSVKLDVNNADYTNNFTNVISLGDINGDGYDDLGVNFYNRNKLVQYDDSATLIILGDNDRQNYNFTSDLFSGYNNPNEFNVNYQYDGLYLLDYAYIADGYVFSNNHSNPVGDINGDGFTEILVSNDYDTTRFLPPAILSYGDLSITQIDDDNSLEGFGYSANPAGDINGDGYQDFIVGNPYNNSDYGADYIIFGSSTLLDSDSFNLTTLIEDNQALEITGLYDSKAGTSVNGNGDINGDGFDDFIIAAPGDEDDLIYVLFGGDFTGSLDQYGTIGNDILAGSLTGENIIAASGDDVIVGYGGADYLSGGIGNDTITFADLNFVKLDGGNDTDILKIGGDISQIDLDSISYKLSSFEAIDLSNYGSNSLSVSKLTLLNLVDINSLDFTIANDTSNSISDSLYTQARNIIISGDSADSLTFKDEMTFFADVYIDNTLYYLYKPELDSILQVLVESEVSITDSESAENQVTETDTTPESESSTPTYVDVIANETKLFVSQPVTLASVGEISYTISRTGDLAKSASFLYYTIDGTSVAGIDYYPIAGVVSFEKNEGQKTISVPLLDDLTLDSDSKQLQLKVILEAESTDLTLGVEAIPDEDLTIIQWGLESTKNIDLETIVDDEAIYIIPVIQSSFSITSNSEGLANLSFNLKDNNYNANTYYYFNSVTQQWEKFSHDGESDSNAEFVDKDEDGKFDLLNLTLTDGGKEDLDATVNGIVAHNALVAIVSDKQPVVKGTNQPDTIQVSLNELVFGDNGGDYITSNSNNLGNNRIYGGYGNDSLMGTKSDRLFGEAGDDVIDTSMGEGNNRLFGYYGRDKLIAGTKDVLFGGYGADTIDASLGGGNNVIYGENGYDTFFLGSNDRFSGGLGEDKFFATSGGNNSITGGKGNDQFWIANGEIPGVRDYITDFKISQDIIGIGGLDVTFEDLTITQKGNNTLISLNGDELAMLRGMEASSLDASDFIFS